jgi:predicted Zn-dependent protease
MIAGCGSASSPCTSWAIKQGGILSDPASEKRVSAIAQKLTAGRPELRVTVRILDSDAVCAYAFPNRRLFVTRGLLERATDDVVAAAVAHEVGHLLGDGHISVASLRGCSEDLSEEGRADALGVELLRAQRVPEESMVRMLQLARDSNSLPPECTRSMNQRIGWLTARLSPVDR